MRVCYFIQSHKNPEQIYRLVRTIKKSSPTAQVLIGHDFTSSYLDMTPLQSLSGVNLLKGNFPVIWGDFSLVQPYLNAINWLFDQNSDFDWLIYISGQHYPTQPLSKIEKFLNETHYDGFIRYFNFPPKSSDLFDFNKIYLYHYYHLPKGLHVTKWDYWLLRNDLLKRIISKVNRTQSLINIVFTEELGTHIGLKRILPPFNDNFICYRGAQWNYLSRKCVEYIKKVISNHQDLVRYYKRTVFPEESLIQTILANSGNFNLCNDGYLYLEFPLHSGHPKLLTVNDYSKMIDKSFHFARKFDLEKDAKILDLLDARIL